MSGSGATLFETLGLYVDIRAPLVVGDIHLMDLQREVVAYTHEIATIGGYLSAQLSFVVDRSVAESWLGTCLGRQVRICSPGEERAWEGFINQATFTSGAQNETRGPLMDIGNQAMSIFTPVNFNVYPPVSGVQTETTMVQNVPSQLKYGAIEKVVSAGSCEQAAAEKLRDTFVYENAWPRSTGGLSFSPGGGDVQITLDLLGNVFWLSAYVYNNYVSGLTVLSTKLKAILSADPNNFISTDFGSIATNNFLVGTAEESNKFAWDIITGMLAIGNDTTDDKTSFGIYNDRKAFYSVIPTSSIAYAHNISDPIQRVVDYNSRAVVYPWAVRPGKWIIIPDFLVGMLPVANYRQDPRMKFIERVAFSAPWDLDISGGSTDALSQLLAKITYSGGMNV